MEETQQIINKKPFNPMKIEKRIRKVVGSLKGAIVIKLNTLVKKPHNFKMEKPRKHFVQLGIYESPGLNFF